MSNIITNYLLGLSLILAYTLWAFLFNYLWWRISKEKLWEHHNLLAPLLLPMIILTGLIALLLIPLVLVRG
jgi:hypothetical protein